MLSVGLASPQMLGDQRQERLSSGVPTMITDSNDNELLIVVTRSFHINDMQYWKLIVRDETCTLLLLWVRPNVCHV